MTGQLAERPLLYSHHTGVSRDLLSLVKAKYKKTLTDIVSYKEKENFFQYSLFKVYAYKPAVLDSRHTFSVYYSIFYIQA